MNREHRRYDPELNAKVRRYVEAQNRTLTKAAEDLERIMSYLRPINVSEDNIYRRCVDAVSKAKRQVEGDAEFVNNLGISDTGVGNLSVWGIGTYIDELSDEQFEELMKPYETPKMVPVQRKKIGYWDIIHDDDE